MAEVRLADNFTFGVEWLIKESGASSSTTIDLGGLGLGTAGLTLTRLASAGDVKLALNALATANRATILSSPRVLARNGETATHPGGPGSADRHQPAVDPATAPPARTGVLQTIQYRNTGVILNVKPVIYSGDRSTSTSSRRSARRSDQHRSQRLPPSSRARSTPS